MEFLIKVIISALLIAISSEIAKRFPGPAGILVALPLTSLISLFWIYQAGATPTDMSAFLLSVGWITLAGLGFFFLTPWLFKMGYSWKLSLSLGALAFIVGTTLSYFLQKKIAS